MSNLGLQFEPLAGGGFPQIYNHHEPNVTPYGSRHLGNFPNGTNAINRWDDIVAEVMSGRTIHAVGFWNGDGQADTMVATFYSAAGDVLGTAGAFKGAFAGIVSSEPIDRIVFNGDTGDGWNHIDGLQTGELARVPEGLSSRTSLWLALGGLLLFSQAVRHRATT